MKERMFTLTWDNSRYPNLTPDQRYRKREARGIVWDSGIVSLANGVVYETMSELEHNLKSCGKFAVEYDVQQTCEIVAFEEQKL